jgi:predicted DsbA family dithiol-disulfide isomerase
VLQRDGAATGEIPIDVWSDLVCPWCYLGKRRLEHALGQLGGSAGFEVRWHAFQLQPDAPRFGEPGAGMPTSEYLRRRSFDPAQAEAMQARVTELAAAEGLAYRLDRSHHVNTFDAHWLIKSAHDPAVADQLVERLFQAQLIDGRRIDDPALLAEIAATVGLAALGEQAGGEAARTVEEDLAVARRLGTRGVPFFVFAGRLGVSGAQPTEVLVNALESASGTEKERADVL